MREKRGLILGLLTRLRRQDTTNNRQQESNANEKNQQTARTNWPTASLRDDLIESPRDGLGKSLKDKMSRGPFRV